MRRAQRPADDGTVLRPTTIDPAHSAAPAPRVPGTRHARAVEESASKGRWIILGVAAAAAAAIVGVVLLGGAPNGPAASPTTGPTGPDVNTLDLDPVDPDSITINRSGRSATVTWKPALDQQDGDAYAVQLRTRSGNPVEAAVRDTVVKVPEDPLTVTYSDLVAGEPICVQIQHRRGVQPASPAVTACEG